MLNKASITWNAKQIAKMAEKGTISFDNAIQRGFVWDVKRKSLFIHSILMGYPVPPFYATRRDGVYDMLDGKQRSNAIIEFINNKFTLKDIPDVQNPDDVSIEEDLNGLCFNELADEYKDVILSYSLTIYYFDGITDEQINEMFYRLNNGKPLSAIELSRAKAKSLDTIRDLANHKLFVNTLTANALSKYVADDLVIKSYMIMNKNTDLSAKNVRSTIEKAEITVEQSNRLLDIFDIIYEIYTTSIGDKKTAKSITKKVNMLGLVGLIEANSEYSPEQFGYFVWNFFPDCTTDYIELCRAHTMSKG